MADVIKPAFPDEAKPLKPSDIPEDSSIRALQYLSFGGGGMKGLGHWGIYKRLVELGVWPTIEEVAGTSAGAIFALFVSLGCTVEEVREEMMNMNYKALQDRDSPGFIESTGVKTIFSLGAEVDPLEAAKKLLSGKKKGPGEILGMAELVEDLTQALLGPELGLWKGEALMYLVSRVIVRKTKDPNLTFKQLAKLHEANPSLFKKLTVVGGNLKKHGIEQREYYTADDPQFEDMRLVDAVRISMSIPIAYRAVTIPITEEEKKRGEGSVRVDGGVFENQPDVYNQGKYYEPSKNAPGNPKALAVSFANPNKEEVERTIKTGIGVIQATIQSKMSEVELRKKYGNNIVFIDPKGVGTLDFDATEAQKLALADSGDALDKTFRNILAIEAEKVLDEAAYAAMDVDELIRRRVALDHMLANAVVLNLSQPKIKAIPEDLRKIEMALKKITFTDEEVKSFSDVLKPLEGVSEFMPTEILRESLRERGVFKKYTQKELEEKEKREKDRIQRRLKALGVVEPSAKEMVEYCERGLDELKAREEEVKTELKKFKLMKNALQWRSIELEAHLKNEVLKNNLFQSLGMLKGVQSSLLTISNELAAIESQQRTNPMLETKHLKNKEELEKKYQDLIIERSRLFEGVQGVNSGNELISDFLKEIRERSILDLNFSIPLDISQLNKELQEEIEACELGIKKVSKDLKNLKKEGKGLKQQLQLLKGREKNPEYYNYLKDFKQELEATLRSQLSWSEMKYHNRIPVLDKLSRHWDESPSFRNNLIGGLIKGLAVFTFSIRMTLGLGLITMPIAYAFRKFSSSPDARRKAERFISAMSLPDYSKVRKLRGFASTTAELVKLMDRNYERALQDENTYLYRLFSEHFKNSGLLFEEVFSKRGTETEEAYLARIKILKQKFKALLKTEVPFRVEDALVDRNANRNAEHLKLESLGRSLDVEKKTSVVEKKGEEEIKKEVEKKSEQEVKKEVEKKGAKELEIRPKKELEKTVEREVKKPVPLSEHQKKEWVSREVMLMVDRKLEILRLLSKPFKSLEKKELAKLMDLGILQNTKVKLSQEEIEKIKDENKLSVDSVIYYFEALRVLDIKIPGDKQDFWKEVHNLINEKDLEGRELTGKKLEKQNNLRNFYIKYILDMKVKFLNGLKAEAERIKDGFIGHINKQLEKDKKLVSTLVEEQDLVRAYVKIHRSRNSALPVDFEKRYSDLISEQSEILEVKDKVKEPKEMKEALKLFVQFHKKAREANVEAGRKPTAFNFGWFKLKETEVRDKGQRHLSESELKRRSDGLSSSLTDEPSRPLKD